MTLTGNLLKASIRIRATTMREAMTINQKVHHLMATLMHLKAMISDLKMTKWRPNNISRMI